MSVRTEHSGEAVWSITFTCYEWISLFEITNGYDLVYDWFNYLRNKKIAEVIAYVIMPNHVHAIIQLIEPDNSLNKIVSNGKRFIAYAIIDRLEKAGHRKIL